jgi:hypothetical protein
LLAAANRVSPPPSLIPSARKNRTQHAPPKTGTSNNRKE